MSNHRDIHGDDMNISKDKNGKIWITCKEPTDRTELCFNKATVEKIIEDLQKQLKEKG